MDIPPPHSGSRWEPAHTPDASAPADSELGAATTQASPSLGTDDDRRPRHGVRPLVALLLALAATGAGAGSFAVARTVQHAQTQPGSATAGAAADSDRPQRNPWAGDRGHGRDGGGWRGPTRPGDDTDGGPSTGGDQQAQQDQTGTPGQAPVTS